MSLLCEVFLLAYQASAPVLVSPEQDSHLAWYFPSDKGIHPSRTVLDNLGYSNGQPHVELLLLHSTSWRFDSRGLILTYLAVLPSFETGIAGWERAVPRPIPEPRPLSTARFEPPQGILPGHALQHGLDHLALLADTDPAVRDALPLAWIGYLRKRLPRPAGLLASAHLWRDWGDNSPGLNQT